MTRAAKVYAFPDTNILIQYQEFTQIDWRKVVNANQVCLVISSVNLRELDRFKFDPRSQRRQKRSRSLIRKIIDMVPTAAPMEHPIDGRPGVTIMVVAKAPGTESHPGLQSDVDDDNLLATILDFGAGLPDTNEPELVFISSDGLANYKAKSQGIKVVTLDDRYLLAPEPDELTSRVKELENRLSRLDSKRPEPVISIPGAASDGRLIVDQRRRNEELRSILQGASPNLERLVESVRLAYQASPRQSTRVSDPYGIALTAPRYDLRVWVEVRSRIHSYLALQGIDCPQYLLDPVDVYADSPPLPWVAVDPKGLDADWYTIVMELADACRADAGSRFLAISNNSHLPIELALGNEGDEGLRGIQVEVACDDNSLSKQLPDFDTPRSPREEAAPIFASLLPEDRPPGYRAVDKLTTQLELLRPKETVPMPMGYLLVPTEPTTAKLRVEIRADNLAEPIEQVFAFVFDEGKVDAEGMALQYQRVYGS